MDLWSFVNGIYDYLADLVSVLNTGFYIGDFRVSFWSLLIAFMIISFVVSIFWKGAKS